MGIVRRIMLTWRVIRIIPKLEYLERTIPKLEALEGAIPKIEALDDFVPHLRALGQVLGRLEALSKRMPNKESFETMIIRLQETIPKLEVSVPKITVINEILERLEGLDHRMPNAENLNVMIERFKGLDQAVAKIEQLGEHPKPVTIYMHENGNGSKPKATVNKEELEQANEWGRLELLSKFVKASEHAKELELEWQKIQQDANNAFFTFQAYGSNTQADYVYKEGISKGIKWCINRFS